MLLAFAKGFGLGGSLIIAIGSQNAFLLGRSIRKQNALMIGTVCIVVDVILIFSGVLGLGEVIQKVPALTQIALYFGAAFLFCYGFLAFKRALVPEGLKQNNKAQNSGVVAAILTTLTLSLLNPHVYLDTVILLGSIGGQLADNQPIWFAIGASVASVIWFYTLVFAGGLLAPWFENPKSWQKLDIMIGFMMWAIAIGLLCS